ncbi:MAG: Ribonuclease Z [Methanothrix sp.]|jgi:ribonuclease Z|nr:MAG: Ribonuclease Z [Methanothrix sp.]
MSVVAKIEVTLLGTGVGIPHSGRAQAGLVLTANEPLLFDCGAGVLLRLSEAGFSPLEVDAVLLSHLHLDHVSDLLPLAKARWLLGERRLDLFGPEGTGAWFDQVRSLYPYLEELDVSITTVRPGDEFFLSGLKIRAGEAVHSLPALGYRIESETRAIVYSGDTEPAPSIRDLAEGADLLVHECSFPEPFSVTNHSTPRRLGLNLKGAGVKRIVLTHLYPQTIGREEEMVRDVRVGLGDGAWIEIGRDLQRIRI